MAGPSVNLIAYSGGLYLLQARAVSNPAFSDGQYPFIFPGAYSLFGGSMKGEKSLEEEFEIMRQEELPGLNLSLPPVRRSYHWAGQLGRTFQKINLAFSGNLDSFLGFNLDAQIPASAAGKRRGGSGYTFRNFFEENGSDHFFVTETLRPESVEQSMIKEGPAEWVPYRQALALAMVPTDKIALLDDLASRIISGQIRI